MSRKLSFGEKAEGTPEGDQQHLGHELATTVGDFSEADEVGL